MITVPNARRTTNPNNFHSPYKFAYHTVSSTKLRYPSIPQEDGVRWMQRTLTDATGYDRTPFEDFQESKRGNFYRTSGNSHGKQEPRNVHLRMPYTFPKSRDYLKLRLEDTPLRVAAVRAYRNRAKYILCTMLRAPL